MAGGQPLGFLTRRCIVVVFCARADLIDVRYFWKGYFCFGRGFPTCAVAFSVSAAFGSASWVLSTFDYFRVLVPQSWDVSM